MTTDPTSEFPITVTLKDHLVADEPPPYDGPTITDAIAAAEAWYAEHAPEIDIKTLTSIPPWSGVGVLSPSMTWQTVALDAEDALERAVDLLERMRAQHHRTGSYAAQPLTAEVDSFLATIKDAAR